MKMTKDKFSKDYKVIINDLVFEHQKKYGRGITITELYKGVCNYYDVTRAMVGGRVNSMVGESLNITNDKKAKLFFMPEDSMSNNEKITSCHFDNGYGIKEYIEKVDRDIIESVRELMNYNQKIFSRTILGSNETAASLIGVKCSDLTRLVKQKEGNKNIKTSYIRSRCEILLRKKELLKGRRKSDLKNGFVIKDYYIEMNEKAAQNIRQMEASK